MEKTESLLKTLRNCGKTLENTRMAKPSRPQLLKAKREVSMAGGLESPKMYQMS